MSVKHVSTGYKPRALQLLLHQRFRRFNVLVCHRRFGKTVLVLNEKIDRGLRCPLKNPQYAYIAPTYGQAKRVAWDYLKEFTKNIPGVIVNEAELRVDIPRPAMGDRVRFQLLGAENPGSIRGMYLDGAVLDEMGEMSGEIWGQVVRPALSDRLGWCIFIGTPKGRNLFYNLYIFAKTGKMPDESGEAEVKDDWYAAMYKASETGIIPKSELEAARQTMTEDEYNQEYECDFQAALVGAYYGKEIKELEDSGKITSVPYEKVLGVETFWDLGISDATSIWFVQKHGREYRIIDYMEESNRDLHYFAKALKSKPYIYDMHTFPHDIEVRDFISGRTRKEVAEELFGRQYVNVAKKSSLEDGINAVKMILSKCWFDSKKCHKGIEALKAYQRKWDSKNNVFMPKPLHDWSSHSADSFRTFAMGIKEDRKQARSELPQKSNSKFNIFSRR